jgi:hypothetical protein
LKRCRCSAGRSLPTSYLRPKQKFKNIEHNNRQPIYEILNDLYENQSNASQIYSLLSTKRINPVIHGSDDRDDL